jgi:hypothetical protein
VKNDVLHFENEVARSRLTVSSNRQVTGALPSLANPREQEYRQVERYHSAAEVALLCKKFEASDFESFDAYYDSLTNTNEDMYPGRYQSPVPLSYAPCSVSLFTAVGVRESP